MGIVRDPLSALILYHFSNVQANSIALMSIQDGGNRTYNNHFHPFFASWFILLYSFVLHLHRRYTRFIYLNVKLQLLAMDI
jgi:hypothetical protein